MTVKTHINKTLQSCVTFLERHKLRIWKEFWAAFVIVFFYVVARDLRMQFSDNVVQYNIWGTLEILSGLCLFLVIIRWSFLIFFMDLLFRKESKINDD